MKKIAILSGDGIGPEVVKQAVKVLDAITKISNIEFEYTEALIGAIAIDETGNPFPDETLKVCQEADAILFGAIGHPKYDNDPSAKVRPEQGLLAMRKSLGLFANIRPVASYKVLEDASPLKKEIIENVDFVVYRELTGGIYFGERGISEDGNTAYDTCTYSKGEITRIAKLAFEAARLRDSRVTLVDKANVLDSSRLWREVVTKMAADDYPDIALDFMFVDNAAMKIIQNPRHFDVLLTGNMFGDILSDESSVIAGSLGLLPSASVGAKVALYEPIHGSYPEVAGQNIANPVATILSAAMLLELSFGMSAEAKLIRDAVEDSLNNGIVTKEINGDKFYSTEEVGAYIAALVAASPKSE